MSGVFKNISGAVQEERSSFEKIYLSLRSAENRIYTDKEVLQLPRVNQGHMYEQEWLVRASSCERLVNYLASKNKSLHILEVGCGNGWLCNQLAAVSYSKVLGIDVNLVELNQAARVFAGVANLQFKYADISTEALENKFDVVVFAASLQYFSSAGTILKKALQLLNPGGEVHIVDTHFYTAGEAAKAKQRSADYFEAMGSEEMIHFYFHHSFDELRSLRYDVLYDPGSFFNRLLKRKNLFHWIRISTAK